MERPENDEEILIKSLSTDSSFYSADMDSVKLLGRDITFYRSRKKG
jgi:hypothetical protein